MKRSRSVSLDLSGSPGTSLKPNPKKVKVSSPVSATNVSPFPDYAHPTPIEANEVLDLLLAEFPDHRGVQKKPSYDDKFSASTSGCGSVPNVIDSLIETILSQNTSAKNSTSAKRSLDAAFGRNNFGAIVDATRAEVVESIKHGGLANKKAATIQNLLIAIYAKRGVYSLQHLAEDGLSDAEAMKELTSYAGVGPKTASCVLLFCLGRESFPVDTHVFRLSKVLGWVPTKANRITAQAHLDLRIPNALKYNLHVLMISHGRSCSGCKSAAKGSCSLKTYLRDSKGVKKEEVIQKVEELFSS